MFAADGNKQEPLREEMRWGFFFGNLVSFFKNRGDKAAVGTFQRDRVVSASGDVTPDGRKNEAQV